MEKLKKKKRTDFAESSSDRKRRDKSHASQRADVRRGGQLTRSVRPFLNSEPSNRADIIFQSARHRQIRDRLISAARTMQARVQFHGAEGCR